MMKKENWLNNIETSFIQSQVVYHQILTLTNVISLSSLKLIVANSGGNSNYSSSGYGGYA